MARPASDTELHQLANELKGITFDDPHDGLLSEAEDLLRTNDLRNVILMKDGKTLAVRMYVGGKQRTIGLTQDLLAACRFADMARMRFWFYRTRDTREPVRSDLHFDLDVVRADIRDHLDAMHLLDKIEARLKEMGAISIEVNSPKEAKQLKEERKTVRDDFNNRFDELIRRQDRLHDMIVECFKHLNDRLTELFKRDRIISPCVDVVDAEVVESVVEQNSSSMKEVRNFEVCVPNPFKDGEIAHRVTIKVPVQIRDGMEILLPEAHEYINAVKAREIQQLLDGATMAAGIEHPQRVEVTPIGVNVPPEDYPVVICPGCKNEIDPEVCHCGDPIKDGYHDNHSPVPQGCDCGRVTMDKKSFDQAHGLAELFTTPTNTPQQSNEPNHNA